jgi:hypothetical protein
VEDRKFFLYRPVEFTPTGASPKIRLVEFRDGEEYIWRPILRGLCKYESAIDGTLDLVDFARMNDALNVFDENARRLTPDPKGR